MTAKLLIDIPVVNWAYTLTLDPEKEYSFGTANGNAVTLPSGSASLRHAVVLNKNGWLIEDCGSETGTYINGQPVTRQELKDRDILKIGKCEAVFQQSPGAMGKQEWDQTHRIIEEHQSVLKDVAQKAESGKVPLNEFEESFVGKSKPTPVSEDSASITGVAAHGKRDQFSPADFVWVAQTLSSVMSAVLSEPASRDETFNHMLTHLKTAIDADNGFVMIPNPEKSRWIIRAWVGDNSQWTQYEKSHPLPLTVTNRAFQTMAIVSNALITPGEEDSINSSSMRALNVNGYIAVPLLEGQQRRGVMYFDTRRPEKKFRPRDAKLLEMAGACILQIEDQKSIG